jgi:4-amino-4-deoxy-L-arabinose transferase-like glycosyltransferase
VGAPPTTRPGTTATPHGQALALPRLLAHDLAAWAVLRWLLPFALIHGLLYLALVPPWQHYDEPTNFEFARMIAETGELSQLGMLDHGIRWEIADSMNRFNFWKSAPQPFAAPDVPFIGYDQRVHPPLYYLVAALPIRATLGLPVEIQLYAARLLSVLLYTAAVTAVWRMSVVLAPERLVAQLVVPLIYACMPPFASLMTAMNSDVLINFTAAALLLGCALLIRDGPRPVPLALVLLSLLVGVLAKRTALLGVVPLALALFWAFARRPLRVSRWLWAVGGAALLILAPLTFRIEAGGPNVVLGLRGWVNALDGAYLRLNLDQLVRSLSDWNNSAEVYPNMVNVAFTSFWAVYGWGDVHMGRPWVWTFVGLSIIVAVGFGLWALRHGRRMALWQRRVVLMFLAVAAMGWLALVLRLHPLPPYGDYFYLPRGRYMFGALPATVWLFALGALGLAPAGWRDRALIALALFFVLYDTFGWTARIIGHYYGAPWPLMVLAERKPGLMGLPPLYLGLVFLYGLVLAGTVRHLACAPRLD